MPCGGAASGRPRRPDADPSFSGLLNVRARSRQGRRQAADRRGQDRHDRRENRAPEGSAAPGRGRSGRPGSMATRICDAPAREEQAERARRASASRRFSVRSCAQDAGPRRAERRPDRDLLRTREVPRASSRLATFAHAISSTNATAPKRTTAPAAARPRSRRGSGRGSTPQPVSCCGNSAASPPRSPPSAPAPRSRRTPGFSRAIAHMYRPSAARISAVNAKGVQSSAGLPTSEPFFRNSADVRGHHADHREGPVVQLDRPADDRRIAAETPLPEPVAQDRDAVVPVGPLVRREGRGRAVRLDAERREEVRRSRPGR